MKCIAIPSGAYTKEELKNENPDLLVNSITVKEEILDFIFRQNPHAMLAEKLKKGEFAGDITTC